MEWEIDDTDSRFSELLDSVDEHGPQQIRHHGRLYILSPGPLEAEHPRNRLVEILTSGPSWDDVTIERLPGKMRDIDL